MQESKENSWLFLNLLNHDTKPLILVRGSVPLKQPSNLQWHWQYTGRSWLPGSWRLPWMVLCNRKWTLWSFTNKLNFYCSQINHITALRSYLNNMWHFWHCSDHHYPLCDIFLVLILEFKPICFKLQNEKAKKYLLKSNLVIKIFHFQKPWKHCLKKYLWHIVDPHPPPTRVSCMIWISPKMICVLLRKNGRRSLGHKQIILNFHKK